MTLKQIEDGTSPKGVNPKYESIDYAGDIFAANPDKKDWKHPEDLNQLSPDLVAFIEFNNEFLNRTVEINGKRTYGLSGRMVLNPDKHTEGAIVLSHIETDMYSPLIKQTIIGFFDIETGKRIPTPQFLTKYQEHMAADIGPKDSSIKPKLKLD